MQILELSRRRSPEALGVESRGELAEVAHDAVKRDQRQRQQHTVGPELAPAAPAPIAVFPTLPVLSRGPPAPLCDGPPDLDVVS